MEYFALAYRANLIRRPLRAPAGFGTSTQDYRADCSRWALRARDMGFLIDPLRAKASASDPVDEDELQLEEIWVTQMPAQREATRKKRRQHAELRRNDESRFRVQAGAVTDVCRARIPTGAKACPM